MSAPHPGTREYRNQTVRISELTILEPFLRDLRFENCQVLGPAILVLVDQVQMHNSSLEADINSLFWVIPADRTVVYGAVGVERCEFYSCRFEGIGFAGPQSLKDAFVSAVN